jgi:hypothetical protein
MTLQPWIANPPVTFTGARTFTPPAYPNTPDPIKLSAPASGRYSTSHPTVSGPLPMHGWRETPGVPKVHPQVSRLHGKRVGTAPAMLDHDDMVKRTVVP